MIVRIKQSIAVVIDGAEHELSLDQAKDLRTLLEQFIAQLEPHGTKTDRQPENPWKVTPWTPMNPWTYPVNPLTPGMHPAPSYPISPFTYSDGIRTADFRGVGLSLYEYWKSMDPKFTTTQAKINPVQDQNQEQQSEEQDARPA